MNIFMPSRNVQAKVYSGGWFIHSSAVKTISQFHQNNVVVVLCR